MGADIRIRRVYDDASPGDGTRVLVDRIWPRGLRKDAAQLDEWAKGIAPSTELRKWYEPRPGQVRRVPPPLHRRTGRSGPAGGSRPGSAPWPRTGLSRC